MSNTRRIAVGLLDAESLARVLTPGSVIKVTEGVPDGARLVRVSFDEKADAYALTFEHESFPVVGRGAEATHFTIRLIRLIEEAG